MGQEVAGAVWIGCLLGRLSCVGRLVRWCVVRSLRCVGASALGGAGEGREEGKTFPLSQTTTPNDLNENGRATVSVCAAGFWHRRKAVTS
jgi:hypothetical protein